MVVSVYIFTEFFNTRVTVKTFCINILYIVGSVFRRNILRIYEHFLKFSLRSFTKGKFNTNSFCCRTYMVW